MTVKAVEMMREIRDKQYNETKGLSIDEQIEFVKKKSEMLKKGLKKVQRSTADATVHV